VLNHAESPCAHSLGDRAFWARAVPQLSIDPESASALPAPRFKIEKDEANRLAGQIIAEGYFASTPFLPVERVRSLAAGVSALVEQGLPPLFVCMYDEFWQFLQGLESPFAPVLGEGYRVKADFWVWHVGCGPKHRGWRVHRDAVFIDKFGPESHVYPDGRPRMCTLWVALTDATLANSCMYLLPKSRDAQFKAFMAGLDFHWIQALHARVDPSQARPAPVPAGSVLGWVPYLLHWGGPSSSEAIAPRISVGIYCTAADVSGKNDFSPTDALRDFSVRRRVAALMIEKYRRSGQIDVASELGDAVLEFASRWAGSNAV
jgi:hypothetical protein